MASKKRVLVLGSTGSIGTQTLDVIRQHSDKLELVGISVYSRVEQALAQAHEFKVSHLCIACEDAAQDPRLQVLSSGSHPRVHLYVGAQGILELIHATQPDIVLNALVGFAGLEASYTCLASGIPLALANKESLVVGGDLLMPLNHNNLLLPVDSEHGAIFQCLLGEQRSEVKKIWLTASGGPFRGCTKEDLSSVTAARALEHPTWNMGPKISIDSSTLMNKGLEVIEAHHLFGVDYEQIHVLVQPQSIIHSMVEYIDGSVKAHLGTTDMRIPIQFALSYPDRWIEPVADLDFTQLGSLDFAAPDTKTFSCLRLAFEAGKQGGTLPCALNAANEVAVEAFLQDRMSYLGIPALIETVLERTNSERVESVEQLKEVDKTARACARELLAHQDFRYSVLLR